MTTHNSDVPQPGDVVAEKYTVVRQLGAGGMGAVLEVLHRVTGKRFAIKWMLGGSDESGTMIQRFIREAKVAGRFQHRNVVEVYDVGQDGHSPYMVMELLEGESLHDRLNKGRLDTEEAIEILIPVMRGVHAAHQAGIVHRDLKPDNIFLSIPSQGDAGSIVPKVLDFGISKVQSTNENTIQLTQAGTVLGTPEYMAPEQVRSLPVDHRTDVYALGVILYQMLSGQLPHSGDSYSDIVIKIATEPPSDLRKINPQVPAQVSEAVAHALAKKPEERFPSVAEFADAIAPLAGLQFQTDGSPTNPSKTLKPVVIGTPTAPARRVGLMAGAGAILASALVAGLFLQNSEWLRPQAEPQGSASTQPAATATPEPATKPQASPRPAPSATPAIDLDALADDTASPDAAPPSVASPSADTGPGTAPNTDPAPAAVPVSKPKPSKPRPNNATRRASRVTPKPASPPEPSRPPEPAPAAPAPHPVPPTTPADHQTPTSTQLPPPVPLAAPSGHHTPSPPPVPGASAHDATQQAQQETDKDEADKDKPEAHEPPKHVRPSRTHHSAPRKRPRSTNLSLDEF